jgi:wingless-type MMTV integration site family protein 4
MYRVTQACTKGEIDKCGCDQNVQKKKLDGNFEWGGCSHNVFFGHKFSRKFVDSSEIAEIRRKNNVEDRLMNLHNNEVGRRVCPLSYFN